MSSLCAAGLALIVAACSDGLPTGPSAVLPESARTTAAIANNGVAAASAGASQTVIPVGLIVDPATCPLVPPGAGVITGSGVLTFVIQTKGAHFVFTVHGHGKATDANGGQWTWSDADLFFSENTAGNATEGTITEGFHLIGPRGQKVMVHGTFHVTVVNGRTVVEIEKGNETEENEPCEGFIFP
ncbi:MAG: hypothetical protein ACRD1Q_06845 [Vicinamibacterales bacterium]